MVGTKQHFFNPNTEKQMVQNCHMITCSTNRRPPETTVHRAHQLTWHWCKMHHARISLRPAWAKALAAACADAPPEASAAACSAYLLWWANQTLPNYACIKAAHEIRPHMYMHTSLRRDIPQHWTEKQNYKGNELWFAAVVRLRWKTPGPVSGNAARHTLADAYASAGL